MHIMNPADFLGKSLSEVSSSLNSKEATNRPTNKYTLEPDSTIRADDKSWEISLYPGDTIRTIFIYLNKGHPPIDGVTRDADSKKIKELFGQPSSQVELTRHIPILGETGPYEKYVKQNYSVHFQHNTTNTGTNVITFTVKEVENVSQSSTSSSPPGGGCLVIAFCTLIIPFLFI
jgi:hypothetical protein